MVDFVGKFENFEEDLKIVSETSGLELSLPHRNKSKSIRVKYRPEDREYISELFKKDYDAFNYTN